MKCEFCEFENQNENEVKRHFYHNHFNNETKIFYCKQCKYETKPCNEKQSNQGFSYRKSQFKSHLKTKKHLILI